MPERSSEIPEIKRTENVVEFRGIKVGDKADFNEEGKALFLKPAFGYGQGPYKVLKILVSTDYPREKLQQMPKVSNYVTVQVQTAKGPKSLSLDYFEQKISGTAIES